MSRIAPGTLRDNRLFGWLFPRAAGLVAGTQPPAVFSVLGRNRSLFKAWLHFSGRLLARGGLRRRDTELVILRVAHHRSSAYEWAHHVHLASRLGFTAEHFDAVREGPDSPLWDARQRVLLLAVDHLIEHEDLDDDLWAAVREHLDEPTVIEFLFLVGHYRMLATVLTTLRIEPDPPATGLTAALRKLIAR
ncbi:carboxymuconolactone decarboxylase family protein [Actinokineospora sp. G85]|uniref:carboxymuconolactone decarboxylase family protein n=1 Tax=Actinokineospora sp. G85 TaxID=3406626 RepID=UPI003C722B6C